MSWFPDFKVEIIPISKTHSIILHPSYEEVVEHITAGGVRVSN